MYKWLCIISIQVLIQVHSGINQPPRHRTLQTKHPDDVEQKGSVEPWLSVRLLNNKDGALRASPPFSQPRPEALSLSLSLSACFSPDSLAHI